MRSICMQFNQFPLLQKVSAKPGEIKIRQGEPLPDEFCLRIYSPFPNGIFSVLGKFLILSFVCRVPTCSSEVSDTGSKIK